MNNLDNLTVEEAIAVTKVLYDLDGVSVGVVLALVCTLLDMTSRKTEMSIEDVLALITVTVLKTDRKRWKNVQIWNEAQRLCSNVPTEGRTGGAAG